MRKKLKYKEGGGKRRRQSWAVQHNPLIPALGRQKARNPSLVFLGKFQASSYQDSPKTEKS